MLEQILKDLIIKEIYLNQKIKSIQKEIEETKKTYIKINKLKIKYENQNQKSSR